VKRKTGAFGATSGSGTPFDLDSLIADDPEARQAARAAEIATAVGEMVRRTRTAHRVTQSDLAERTGSSQAHVSELERGLGPNGPTVVTLGRIMDELGEEMVIETGRERAAWNAEQAAEAKSWLTELLGASSLVADPGAALREVSAELQEADANPFRRMLVEGVLTGLQLGARLPVGSYARQVTRLTAAAEATTPGTARHAAAGAAAGAAAAAAVTAREVAGTAAAAMKEGASGQASGALREHGKKATGAPSGVGSAAARATDRGHDP